MCSELAVQVDKDQDKFIDVHTIQLTKGGSELIISSRSVSLFIFIIPVLILFLLSVKTFFKINPRIAQKQLQRWK